MRTEIFGHSHFSGVLAKEAICTFKNNKGSDKSLTDVSVQCLYWTSDDTKRTSSHFPSLDVEISLLSLTMGAMCILNNDKLEAVIDFSPPPSSRKGPFILVAWNYKQQHNDEKKQTVECTSLICLYDLLTKECLSFARFDPKESLEDSSESDVMKNFKVSQITAIPTRSEDGGTVDISTMTVVVGLETKTKTGKIEGYLGKFKINTDDPVLINGKIQVEKVHNNKLSCVHTIHTIERDIAYTGSYDKTFSICKLDDVLEKASPMEKMVISTHSDIILSVVPLDPKPENVWNRFPMFTASWDTTIRYWERNQLGWASYQFPYEHKKKVSCLAYGAFPLQVPRDSDKTSSCLETSCENNLPCARNVSCVSCYNSCCECSNIDLESDKMCYFLVSGCLDCTLIVWDVSKPKKPVLAKRLVGHEDEVQFVKLLCQGQPTVISASRDRTIRFWDLFTGECFRILKTDFLITGLDISRMYVKHKDKKLESGANQELGDIVVASSDTELLCWNFLSNLRRFMQYTEGLVVSLTTGPQTSAPTNITSINDPCNIYAGTSRASVVVSLNSKQTKVVNVAGQTGEKEIKGRTEAEVTMYTENALAKHKQVRVNALLWVSSSMRGQPFMENVLIAGLADGNICIRVTSVVDPPSFQTTMQNVFCLAWYQPKTNSIVQTPLLFVGGMIDDKDHTMQIFDLDKLLSSSDDNFSVVKHHEAQKTFTGLKFVPVRDVAVHHLADGYAVFITADYKCDTIIWFIHSDNQFEKLQILQGLHCSTFIMNVRIFNPFKEWKKAKGSQKEDAFDKVEWSFIHVDERDKKSCVKYLLKDCEVVVTGGYDGKIGLWPIRTDSLLTGIKKLRSSQNFNRTQTNNAGEQIIGQNEKNNDEKIDFKSMEHEKLQSVTAMTIFFPNGGTNIHPLLLTGSIDALIYVWDIYNQTRLRVLTGHSERINSLVTYFRHGTQPILVSGGDDKCITFWEDGLKHHQYPPSKHTILRAFYHDVLAPHDAWQQIKILQSHYPNVLWEFPHLFYLALIERRESFFVEFIHDLKKVITRIPKYPRLEEGQCSRWMHHKPEGGVDILEYAMHSNTLLALRAILLAWSEVLNKDIEDSINQKALYANRMFNDKLLFELAAIFPVEYTEFISSIRLVRAHSSVGSVNGDLTRTIPFHNRSMVIGSNSFPLDSNFESKRDNDHYKPWCLNMFCYCRPMKSFFSLLRLFKVQVLDGEERHKQSVTPFMLPIKHFSDVKHLYCAVRACNTLHRVDLFESDLLIAAIHHNWNTRGWRIYMTTLVQYGLTVILFVIAIYSYHNVTSTSNEVYGAWRKCRRSMAAFMFFLSLFGLNECFQVFGKYKRLYNFTRQNMKFSRIAHIIVNHFACDWWNIVDCAVVVVGILGMHGRYRRLGNCEEYYNVQHAHEGKYYCLPTESDSFTSCLLAATAVLLWFKVLYFLRPFKAAGQFGKFTMFF
jgi:WD40 repeat protein